MSIGYQDALKAADNQIIFRETVKGVALKHRLKVVFLPKVAGSVVGNACHVHASLWKDGVNILNDGPKGRNLSETANSFIAGILKHIKALMAFTAPTIQSYNRIKPGVWCGAFATWGWHNRETALRMIENIIGHSPTHFEYRTCDVTSNPYLVLGAMIIAGMDGIKNNLRLPEPIQVLSLIHI
eukprot:TRINITY_DN1801_c0_g1_i3.p1 TRINITY_DN1801_c0_g1~~TRINITY_DN1801_c0_g1_i3.p1  ORF type:complete len:183 (-),score=30.93 TRINITY_DN1801_c0_g1_i3:61-609(-)